MKLARLMIVVRRARRLARSTRMFACTATNYRY